MTSSIFSIGVDLGGTWIRLEAVDAQARRVRSLKAPAPPLSQLPAFLKRRLHAWKVRPPYLIVASRGVWTRPERSHLKRALRALAHHVTVMSDVEAAWHAAFGRPSPHPSPQGRGRKGEGIVVISGTGSIAYGSDASGRSKRAGGLGPLVGDEGSAFWIGKEWLKRNRGEAAKPSHQTVRRIAALAPRVLNLARKGNPLARELVNEAQQHLSDLVVQAAGRLHFRNRVPVSWGGSLLNNPAFRAGFLRALRRRGRRYRISPPRLSPVSAIAGLPVSS